MDTVATLQSSGFVQHVNELLDRVEYRLAETDAEKDAIFRLRYDSYLREDAIDPNRGKRFTDDFDANPNTMLFGVFVDDVLASSIRLNVGTQLCPELPALRGFSDFLLPEIKAGRTAIDPTRFVIDYDSARRYPSLPYATIRLAGMAADFFDVDLLLATVRLEHQAFYRRVFGYRVICEARPYFGLKKPLSLMAADYRAGRERVHRRYPFFASTVTERNALFGGRRVPARTAGASLQISRFESECSAIGSSPQRPIRPALHSPG
jgi:hypothetical protein